MQMSSAQQKKYSTLFVKIDLIIITILLISNNGIIWSSSS